jgi:Cu(I)/Ag(I) efflux system membrane fusion protein
VVFQADLGERLTVPESAVLYTGPRRVVFVDLGGGRMRPQEVQLGARAGGYFEVLDGLEAGDIVVTSGNFLIASESRLKSAAFWADEESGDDAE